MDTFVLPETIKDGESIYATLERGIERFKKLRGTPEFCFINVKDTDGFLPPSVNGIPVFERNSMPRGQVQICCEVLSPQIAHAQKSLASM